jgi:hypothetical protein
MVGAAAIVLLGILSIGGWVGFKALTPAPQAASARPALIHMPTERNTQPVTPETIVAKPETVEPEQTDSTPVVDSNNEDSPEPAHREIVITASDDPQLDSAGKTPTKTLGQPADDKTPDTATVEPDRKSAAEQTAEVTLASITKPTPSNIATGESKTKSPTTQPASKSPTTQPARRQATAKDYPSGLSLTGVMYGKTSRRAIISGTVVYEGAKINNAKVVKILPDSVEIEANGFRFLLGTGPKPVWLKTTQVPEIKAEEAGESDNAPTDGASGN